MKKHVLCVATLAICLSACVSLPTSQAAGVSYAATPSTWPAETACLNPAKPRGIAKEIMVGSMMTIAIAGGDKAISDDDWRSFDPGFGNTKNSDRHLLFQRSCFSRSPSRPSTCTGDDCRDIVEVGGHTWVALSKVEAADCWPNASACAATGAHEGGLFVVVTRKCHELVFEGSVRMLRGPHGESAVMHATADGHPTLDVQLPPGWTLQEETLSEPLVVHPFGGGDACFYNIIRDHRLQSYHQLSYATSVYP